MTQVGQKTLSEQQAYAEAVAAFEQGRYEDGLDALAPFVPVAPTNYRFWHLHGLLLRALDRREEALKSLQRSVQFGPEAPGPAHALARTLYEAGLPSVQAYGRALKLAPADRSIVTGLASAFIAEGDPGAALSGLERIVSRSPHWVEGHVLLAKLRWAQGEREGFARSFDDALRERPQDMDLRREQIIALMHAEQWDDTLRAIAQGRAAMGEQVVFDLNEAVVFSETGDIGRAGPLLASYASLREGPVQVRRVRHFLRSGRPEEADRIISEWIGDPEAYMFWPYASVAWRMLGDSRWEWLEGDERFVGVYDLADRLPPLDKLADKLRKLHTLGGQPLEQSLRGGTQTDGDIFTHIDPVLVQTREAIRASVAEHVAQLPGFDDSHPLLRAPREPIRFSGAWSVRLKGGGFHANHVHPVGWISSALYIALPSDVGREEAGVLTLGDPSSPTMKIDVPPFRTVEPRPGRLALFPSYMWHGTRPFGDGERMTIAFDVARTA